MTPFTLAVVAAEAGEFNPLDPSGIGISLWTWVIFLVALPLMWKVVMGPVSRALVERDQKAAEAIVAAEKASREAQEARASVEKHLADARREAAATVEAARSRAEARERELVAQAEAKADAMLDRARAEIRSEQDKALAAIRRQVVDLSLAAAGQVLRRKVDAQDDRRLVEELVAGSAGAKPREGRS